MSTIITMKNYIFIIFILIAIIPSCNESYKVQQYSYAPEASDICSGKTILGVVGTANCLSSDSSLNILSFASRKDNGSFPDPSTFPLSAVAFDAFFTNRTSSTLAQELAGGTSFSSKHSLVPNALYDSDGRNAMEDWLGNPIIPAVPAKRHYLETIAVNDPIITLRANILECGTTGTIAARIENCKMLNGLWAFYNGEKYGQDGEGDWSLVSVVGTVPKFEVWRDERTKLIWSDKPVNNYNWYRAAGYSKPDGVSDAESGILSSPGTIDPDPGIAMQPLNPVSVCIDADVLNNGEGTATYTYVGPSGEIGDDTNGYSFKGNLMFPQVTWRLPSRNDWGLAEVNGIRKVLPNIESGAFWTTSTFSKVQDYAWTYNGIDGHSAYYSDRYDLMPVRCVASTRD